MTAVPDVSVVVAVYNTMPYLTECLNSLVKQSIGQDRLQVVAVDDGSTDGSGAELDRFAALYPSRPSRSCTSPTPVGRRHRATAAWSTPPAGTSSSSAPTTTWAPRRWSGSWTPPTSGSPTSSPGRMVGVNAVT